MKKKTAKEKKRDAKRLAFIGIMSAFSAILMMFGFPLPFAPSFMSFDISTMPALFAGFFVGPISGCCVVVIKILLKLIIQGTNTGFMSEIVELAVGIVFVLTSALIYKWKHTTGGAILGMTVSSLLVSVMFVFIDAYIFFPLYSELFGLSMESIVAMGTAVNPAITDITALLWFSVFPFNLIKHIATSVIAYLIYIRVGKTLSKLAESKKKKSE